MRLLIKRIFYSTPGSVDCISCKHSEIKGDRLNCKVYEHTTFTLLKVIEVNHLYCGQFKNALKWRKL